jgi:uncharacterized protein (DUF1330 family)
MTAYAIARLRNVNMGPEIAEYLRLIDETLEPFRGRFIVHGGSKAVLEGSWPEDLIVIEFPDEDCAHAWYNSPAYRKILRLRTDNSEGDVIIVKGVEDGHCATDILAG